MGSELFRLNSKDFFKGALTTIFAAAFFVVVGLFQQPSFDLFAADWSAILKSVANAALAAFVGYIGKQFVSDSEGRPLGIGSK